MKNDNNALALAASILQPGTVLVIAGKQGVGKSTLAQAIAGAVTDGEGLYRCSEGVAFSKRCDTGGVFTRNEVVIVEEFADLRNLEALEALAATSTAQIIVTTFLSAEHFTSKSFMVLTIRRGNRS